MKAYSMVVMFAVLSVAAIIWRQYNYPDDAFTSAALATVAGFVLLDATVIEVKRVLKGGRK
jgi:hypothetical protein